uniref:Uncharacterized protein n=1 Tax=Lepeophtheirus salmonis TaxID=72036 RepID=A0A0K2VGI1_LEPSM
MGNNYSYVDPQFYSESNNGLQLQLCNKSSGLRSVFYEHTRTFNEVLNVIESI